MTTPKEKTNRKSLYVFWMLVIAAYIAMMCHVQQHPARDFAADIDELRLTCSQKTGVSQ